jgi:Kef-type K+ transport system membrane component KefB
MDELFVRSLGLTVIGAAVVAALGRKLRIPSIVAYLLAGLWLGPATGWLEVGENLAMISEAGIALLLFLVGLELSLHKVRDVGKVAVAAGLGQVVFTAVGGYLVCWALGFSPMEGLFLAVALTFSSTVVVVKLLDEKGHLDSLYGRIAVGIFLVQDLVVIVVLTVMAGLARGGDSFSFMDIAYAFGGMAVLLAATLAASRWLLPRPFAWAARSPGMIFIWALGWCFLVVLAAHALGLSLEIGAFLAGLALAQLPYNEDLRRRVHPLMNFFIAVFFVTLGAGMNFDGALQQIGPSLVLALFVLIGNPFIFMLIIGRMGYGEKTAFSTSVTVAQISEFSFIFAAAGVATGLIGENILSITALVGVITIALSAYMILYSDALYIWCRRWKLLKPFGAADKEDEEPPATRAGHVIVVGMNALGREIVRRLHDRGEQVLAIDTDPAKLADLPGDCMLGNVDYRAVRDEAGLPAAKLAVSALQIEATNLLFAYHCRQLGVPCAIHAFDVSLMEELVDVGADYLITPKIDGALAQRRHLLESTATQGGAAP